MAHNHDTNEGSQPKLIFTIILNLIITSQIICGIIGLKTLHNIHVWNLTDKFLHFECHLNPQNDLLVSETNSICSQTRKILHNEFDVEHVTLQFEFGGGDLKCCEC